VKRGCRFFPGWVWMRQLRSAGSLDRCPPSRTAKAARRESCVVSQAVVAGRGRARLCSKRWTSAEVIKWLTVPNAADDLIKTSSAGLAHSGQLIRRSGTSPASGIDDHRTSHLPCCGGDFSHDEPRGNGSIAVRVVVVTVRPSGVPSWYLHMALAVLSALGRVGRPRGDSPVYTPWIMVILQDDGSHGMYNG